MFNNCVGDRGRGDSLERQAKEAIDGSYEKKKRNNLEDTEPEMWRSNDDMSPEE